MEEAARLDPDEAGYAFLLGAFRLRRGAFHEAVRHFDSALAQERSPFYRGQLLLWGSRAAEAAGLPERAEELRSELLSLPHPLLAGHHESALRERARPVAASRLKTVKINPVLSDIAF